LPVLVEIETVENISRNLPVVSGAGRFEVGPRAGFGQVLAFWPVLASFASKISVL
jgi:hypothetical protein